MRYLFIAVAVVGLGVGCATPQVPSQPPMSAEVERWQRQYQEECERAEALAVRLAEAESALELAAQERADSVLLTRFLRLMEDELGRAEAERHSLAEHNAQLVSQQREMTELQEELEDVWYQSALSRARRRIQSQPPQAPAAQPPATQPSATPPPAAQPPTTQSPAAPIPSGTPDGGSP